MKQHENITAMKINYSWDLKETTVSLFNKFITFKLLVSEGSMMAHFHDYIILYK